MKSFFTLCLLVLLSNAFAQQKDIARITDSIQTEGKMLYRSEMASWYGTDVFVAQCKDKRPQSGGYLSYDTGNGETNIFFSKGDSPKVLASIAFEKNFNPNVYKLDTVTRNLTTHEKELYIIRQKTLAQVYTDTLFKRYQNTDLNLIPVVSNGHKRVYILTGPQNNGVVIIGNDYLLEFNNNNELISKKRLHKTTLFLKSDPNNPARSAIHSHLPETGDFMTATDVCTTMLYERSAGWQFHMVISKNYVSSWNCEQNQLVILTREAWEKIAKTTKDEKN